MESDLFRRLIGSSTLPKSNVVEKNPQIISTSRAIGYSEKPLIPIIRDGHITGWTTID